MQAQPRPKLFGLCFELVICPSHLLVQHFFHSGVEIGGRQSQVGLAVRTVTFDPCARSFGDLDHRRVFAQRMDKQQSDAFVACVCNGPLEQPCAVSSAPRGMSHRHTKFRTAGAIGVYRVGQVRHGDEVQTPVVDPKQAVSLKVQAVDVFPDLLVRRGVSKSEVPIIGSQGFQVLVDFANVGGFDFSNRDGLRQIRFAGRGLTGCFRRRPTQPNHPQPAFSECIQPIVHAFILRVNPIVGGLFRHCMGGYVS